MRFDLNLGRVAGDRSGASRGEELSGIADDGGTTEPAVQLGEVCVRENALPHVGGDLQPAGLERGEHVAMALIAMAHMADLILE
ncbi:hypothetical protein WME94_01080 [Sorangium sp. So ce429]